MTPAIVVENVSKTFRRYHPERPWTFQEMLGQGLSRMRALERFRALRHISFRVAAGRTLGIIGANGSGKSTLLRLMAGVGRPDAGRVVVHGRIGALLDLGAGFHPDLTGRENALISGVLGGLTRRQVEARLDAIVAFAEVEPFIDHPLRTYSTGMQMRLAFATAVHTEPEVLLIDEVLSVGDIAFQRKCLDRITEFKAADCSIVLVSHEASVVQDLCDEALWLDAGRLMAQGSPSEVVRQFVAHMQGESAADLEQTALSPHPSAPDAPATVRTEHGREVVLNESRFGSLELEITAVRVLDQEGRPVGELRAGQPLRIEVEFYATMRIVGPLFCVRIAREDRLVCYDLTTEMSELSLAAIEGRGQIAVTLDRVDLNSGSYMVDAGCYAREWAYAYDYHSAVSRLVVHGDGMKESVLNSPHRWELADVGRTA